MKKDYNAFLSEAKDSIRNRIGSYRISGEKAPDESVCALLESCEAAIDAIQESFVAYTAAYYTADEYEKLKNDLSSWGVELDEYDSRKMGQEKAKALKNCPFPMWDSAELNKVLSTNQKPVMKILPYILSAYYFDIISGVDVFPAHNTSILLYDSGNVEQGYSKSLNSLCQKLSLENYIESQCKVKFKHYRDEGQQPTDRNGYIEMISNSQNTHLMNYHAAKIMQAFIYSLFAHLCTLNTDIDNLVDYKASFELYNLHTCAFHTRYNIIDEDEIENKDIKKDVNNDSGKLFDADAGIEYRIERAAFHYENAKLPAEEIMEKSDRTCFKACGLDRLYKLPQVDSKDVERNLYRSLAGILCARLHPVFCQLRLWPTIYPYHYLYPMWYTTPNKIELSPKQHFAMPWDSVKPFFYRRLGKTSP